jgi:hypothetical protein
MAASLERQQIGEQFKLLDPARFPEKPIAPDRRVHIAAGAGVGLGLGIIRIFVRRKKLSVQPEAAAESPVRGRLWFALKGLVFVLLSSLLLYQVATLP